MSSLVRVELTRYRTRRIILLIVAGAALLSALVALKTAYDTRPPSATEIATAKAEAELEADRAGLKADLDNCIADARAGIAGARSEDQCRADFLPTLTDYYPRETLDLEGTLKGNGIGIALLVVALLIIAGSTFAGADWSSGSIRNQVLFEPRRTRVWGAKVAAVAIWSAVVSSVVLGGFWLSLFLVAADRDVPHSGGVAEDVVWHLVRAVVLATAASVGAFALTTILKHSVGTLSLLFAYSIGGELLVYLLPISGMSRWSLGNNVFGWLETRLEFFDSTSYCARMGTCEAPVHISHLDAGLYLLAVLAVAVVGSWVVFRRRDI